MTLSPNRKKFFIAVMGFIAGMVVAGLILGGFTPNKTPPREPSVDTLSKAP